MLARAHIQTLIRVLRGRSRFALRLTGEVSYVHLVLQLTDQISIRPLSPQRVDLLATQHQAQPFMQS